MSLIVKAPAKKEKQSPYTYAWKTVSENCFDLDVPEKISMRIWKNKTVWNIRAFVGGQKYFGERYNLESAAKACDRMLYKKFPHIWTVTDPRVIIRPWSGDIASLMTEDDKTLSNSEGKN